MFVTTAICLFFSRLPRQVLFESPFQPIVPSKMKTVNGEDKVIPLEFVSYTRTKPVIPYRVNFDAKTGSCLSDKMLVPKGIVANIERLFSSSVKFEIEENGLKLKKSLLGCKILEKSVGLSFLHRYSAEEQNEGEEIDPVEKPKRVLKKATKEKLNEIVENVKPEKEESNKKKHNTNQESQNKEKSEYAEKKEKVEESLLEIFLKKKKNKKDKMKEKEKQLKEKRNKQQKLKEKVEEYRKKKEKEKSHHEKRKVDHCEEQENEEKLKKIIEKIKKIEERPAKSENEEKPAKRKNEEKPAKKENEKKPAKMENDEKKKCEKEEASRKRKYAELGRKLQKARKHEFSYIIIPEKKLDVNLLEMRKKNQQTKNCEEIMKRKKSR